MPSSLPLYPDVPFTDGDLATPELFYLSFYAPIFDGQTQYLGHRQKLLDAELSDDPGAIKARVGAIDGSFKVTGTGGLNLAYASGTCVLPNGDTLAVASGTLAAPDNATSFVWINSIGTVQCGTIPPVYRTMLAKVVAATGTISQILDYRGAAYRSVMPVARSIKSFGGSSVTDFTASAGTTLDQGVYYFRNFTVPAGITLNISQSVKIYCQNFTCAGTIVVSQIPIGAPQGFYSLSSLGSVGGVPGGGVGGAGQPYGYGIQGYGSGGGQGQAFSSTNSWGYVWGGGSAGGCFWVEAAGTVSISGTIQAIGGNGGQGGTGDGTQGNNNAAKPAVISGSSGGSGGLIYLASLASITVSATATLDVRGGNGGQGFNNLGGNTIALGGLPGGGGTIVCSSPANNTTGATLLVSGGAHGIPALSGTTSYNAGTRVTTGTGVTAQMGASNGGAFGGITGGYSVTGTASSPTITPTAPGDGKVFYNSFVPIA